MRRAAKSDSNRAGIVHDLRLMGIAVYDIRQPVDLLCWWPRTGYHIVEIKNPDGSNRLTTDQEEFLEKWPGPVHIVRNTDEAIRAICGDKLVD